MIYSEGESRDVKSGIKNVFFNAFLPRNMTLNYVGIYSERAEKNMQESKFIFPFSFLKIIPPESCGWWLKDCKKSQFVSSPFGGYIFPQIA